MSNAGSIALIFDDNMKVFNIVTGVCSIIGVIVLLFSDYVNSVIALLCLVCFLILLLILVIETVRRFIKKSNVESYEKVSVFMKFETSDSTHSIFEMYRVIQAKRIVLTEVEQFFKWSGSRLPKVTSKAQLVKDVVNNDTNTYDKAILVLKEPLLFNETGVLHFHAELDDYDGKAIPCLEHKVDMPVSIIHFRIILRHKNEGFDVPAKLMRRKIDSCNIAGFETLESVTFDTRSKSYEYHLISPEVGYFYRIEWEK